MPRGTRHVALCALQMLTDVCSVCLSVPLILSLPLSFCLCLYLSVNLSFCLSVSFSVTQTIILPGPGDEGGKGWEGRRGGWGGGGGEGRREG